MQYADYLTASLGDMQQALAQRRVSARQLTTFALQRIADVDQPRYNAISWLFADDALAAAAASDAARQQNAPVGPLAGIPLLIKDNIEVKGWPTSAGSALLRDVIASEDAPLVTALRQAGAILIGKTTMHELAAGITGASSLSGFTHNAWQQGRSPGGSSSGSAVAVAAGFVPLSPTQDIPGPLVRHAADLRLISEILTGQRFSRPDRPLRIGIWQEGFAAEETEINQAVQDAVAPFQPRMLSWPQLETLAAEANIIAYEFADALAAWLADKSQAPLRTLAAIAASGRYHPQLEATFKIRAQHPGMQSDGYREVQLRQQRLYQQLAQFFQQQQIDLLAYPVVRHPPVKHGELQPGSNALISAVTGAPAISIPVGLSTEGLPIGLELLALREREDVLLMAAEQIEQAHPPFNCAAPAL